jgi:hypothetical protein
MELNPSSEANNYLILKKFPEIYANRTLIPYSQQPGSGLSTMTDESSPQHSIPFLSNQF